MTDKKISELTQITGADVDDANDELAIVDASASETKAITRAELLSSVSQISTTGDLTVGGDLTVNGTTTTVNTETLDVEDKNITVAFGATDAASANGAGLTVDGADATFTYTSADDSWNLNKGLNVPSVDINGGSIDGVDITADTLNVDSGTLYVDSGNNRVDLKNARILEGDLSFEQEDSLISITPENFINLRSDNLGSEVTINSSGYFSSNDFVLGAMSNGAGSGRFIFGNGGTSTDDSSWKNTFRIATNGDISFYEDTGTTPKFFWDASAEKLEVGSIEGGADGLLAVKTNASNHAIAIEEASGAEAYAIGVESDGSLGFYNSGSTTASVIFDDSGNVGIGTSSPAYQLQVSSASNSILALTAGSTDTAQLFLGDAASPAHCRIRYDNSDNNLNFVVNSSEAMRIDSSGNVGIGTSSPSATLDVNGSLSKNSGSFKIDHPIKPDTHHLVHSFVEGPQADNLYRGKVTLVDGQATVNLDEAGRMTQGTFAALNGNVQCFTTNEDGWTQVRGSVSGNILTIEAQDPTCVDEVSWLVIGERHDQHMIDTEWTDENGRVITEPEKTLEGAE